MDRRDLTIALPAVFARIPVFARLPVFALFRVFAPPRVFARLRVFAFPHVFASTSVLALLPVFAVLAVVLPTAAVAQLPTPEEYAQRAEESENAPLFQSFEPLKITLRTDIEWLLDERNDSVEVAGTATFIDLDGSEVVKPVDVRTRGLFRMNKRNCNFPPLRLDFPQSEMEGTVFEGQNRLKLVTPCDAGRDNYQTYIYVPLANDMMWCLQTRKSTCRLETV